VQINAPIPTTLTTTLANFNALKPLNNATFLFLSNTSIPFLLQVTGLLPGTSSLVEGLGKVPRYALFQGSYIRAKKSIFPTIAAQ
jgi:hypothetical protein